MSGEHYVQRRISGTHTRVRLSRYPSLVSSRASNSKVLAPPRKPRRVRRICASHVCACALRVHSAIQLFVLENHQRTAQVYDRKTAFLLDGEQLGVAKSTCYITDDAWIRAVRARLEWSRGCFL